MKLKYLLPAAAAVLPLLASGRPAYPGLVNVTNPDGSVTQIRIHGDENFSFVTDADNNCILEKNAKGFWQQATRNGQPLLFNDNSITLLQSEAPQMPTDVYASGPQRMASLDSEGRSTFPTIGENHFPVVLLEFSDTPFSVPNPHDEFYRLCNEKGYSDYGGRGSVRDFYMANSNNKFLPTFDVYGPIKLSHPSAYYVAKGSDVYGAGKYGRFGEALQEAMLYIKNQGIDFTQYDHDLDGDIDFVYFFYSGHGQADSGRDDCIWPHQSDFHNSTILLGLEPIYFESDNWTARFGPYACSNELRGNIPSGASQPYMDGIGAFCHEFGHVLGLPDLYDAPRQNGNSTVYTKTPGDWSTMDSGTYNLNSTCPPLFSAYEQWVCNWLDYTDLSLDEEGSHCKLETLGSENRNAYRLRIRRNTPTEQYFNEYYILENRGKDGWDEGLPESGMLVWRINYSNRVWNSNSVNTGGVSNVEIISASESNYQTTYPTADGLIDAIYPGAEGELVPKSVTDKWRCFVTDITRNEDNTIDFDYNVITEMPDVATVLHDNPTRAENGKRYVYLTWDAHPDADSYFVTVKRRNASGTEIVVDGFNEKNVGNVTQCEILNISSSAFNQTFTAYVRVKARVPSSKTSNVITFVPSELPQQGSSVDAVATDNLDIRGLKGEIVAPQDAVIFNMNGVEVGRSGLPAGIYLVKVADKVCKVVVR